MSSQNSNDACAEDRDFAERMADLDEAISTGIPVEAVETHDRSRRIINEASECLQLIERVREHSPDCLADFLSDRRSAEAGQGPGDDIPVAIGRFQIRRRLGQGGFGVVFLADDPEIGREVALKVPNVEALVNDVTRRRFLREAQAAGSLRHPNIAAVYEAGHVGPICYIASEFCAGGTLAARLNNGDESSSPALSPSESAELVLALADAVQHAHSQGILHRDLKPGNVLIDDTDRDRSQTRFVAAEDLRIADFGLAKVISEDEGLTQSNAIVGTPQYMAPEQTMGDALPVGTAADIYALGAILYELLTGRAPFRGSSMLETMQQARSDEPVPPRRLQSSVPVDLESICLKCLEKDPQRRYESAGALKRDLSRFLSGVPVRARPVNRLERWLRWCRRRPGIAALSLSVLLLVFALIAGSLTAAMWLAQARQETLDNLQEKIVARDEATRNEDLALRAMFEARLSQISVRRTSRSQGQRTESLQAAARTAKLIPRIKPKPDDLLFLRNEVAAAMSLIDVVDDTQWPYELRPGAAFANSPDGEQYAVNDPETGDVVVRRLDDNSLIATLDQSDPDVVVRNLSFSPDGKYLACSWDRTGKLPRLQVWDVEQADVVCMVLLSSGRTPAFDFSSDGDRIAVGTRDKTVQVLDLPEFFVRDEFAGTDSVECLRFHPDGSVIAVYRGNQLECLDARTGETLQKMTDLVEGECADLAWSPDGRLVAAARSTLATLWDVDSGQAFRHLSHPGGPILAVDFHPAGRLLATSAEDNLTKVWSVDGGSSLLHLPGRSTTFSDDGVWLGTPGGRRRVVMPDAYQVLIQPRPSGEISAPGLVSVHPNGRLLAASNRAQTVFWDLVRGEVAAAVVDQGCGRFSPAGEHFVRSSADELSRRSVTTSDQNGRILYRFGPLRKLSLGNVGEIDMSEDGRVIACVDRYQLSRITLHNERTSFSGILTPGHERARWLDMTPSGNLLATGTWRGVGIRIWDCRTGALLRTLPAGSAKVAFSPDESLLAVDEGREFTVWNVSDWRPVLEAQAKSAGSLDQGAVAFSPDGTYLAIADAHNVVRLLDGRDFAELVRFTLSSNDKLESLTFSPDSKLLIAGARGYRSSLHVWNLFAIRRQLRDLNLDWNHPSDDSTSESTSQPLQISFDAG